MKKVYQVIHIYDVDGGFGDAVEQHETVAIFESKTQAEAFVKAYSQPHVYDRPFCELKCGELAIIKRNVITDLDANEIDCWWVDFKEPYFEEGEEKKSLDISGLKEAFKPV